MALELDEQKKIHFVSVLFTLLCSDNVFSLIFLCHHSITSERFFHLFFRFYAALGVFASQSFRVTFALTGREGGRKRVAIKGIR
jgi:hypothetical protein